MITQILEKPLEKEMTHKDDELLILLPYPDFFQSAMVLSPEHAKQTMENITRVLSILSSSEHSKHKGTICHYTNPNVKFWRMNQATLKFYYNMLLCKNSFDEVLPPFNVFLPVSVPIWFGNEEFHYSHRCYCLQDDHHYYQAEDKFDVIKPEDWYEVMTKPLFWGIPEPPSLAP